MERVLVIFPNLFKKRKPKKQEKMQQCSMCGNSYPERTFRNGHGQHITWCQDCGKKMCESLLMC